MALPLSWEEPRDRPQKGAPVGGSQVSQLRTLRMLRGPAEPQQCASHDLKEPQRGNTPQSGSYMQPFGDEISFYLFS